MRGIIKVKGYYRNDDILVSIRYIVNVNGSEVVTQKPSYIQMIGGTRIEVRHTVAEIIKLIEAAQ